MTEKKYYNILLIAEKKSCLSLENLRMDLVGSKLVDLQPPHVTIKRKFSLKNNFSEKDLVELLKNFEMSKIIFPFDKLERFGDAIVLSGKNRVLFEKHKELVALLKDYTQTVNPEWEENNFTAHLTIVQDPENRFQIKKEDLGIKEIPLDEIRLVEIDPAPIKIHSRLLYSKILI
ncbi:MAG: hypothetical protein WAV73_04380 [Candidatus Moraniibacteriota bacterium]